MATVSSTRAALHRSVGAETPSDRQSVQARASQPSSWGSAPPVKDKLGEFGRSFPTSLQLILAKTCTINSTHTPLYLIMVWTSGSSKTARKDSSRDWTVDDFLLKITISQNDLNPLMTNTDFQGETWLVLLLRASGDWNDTYFIWILKWSFSHQISYSIL